MDFPWLVVSLKVINFVIHFLFIILNNLHILYLPPTHIFLEIQLIIPSNIGTVLLLAYYLPFYYNSK